MDTKLLEILACPVSKEPLLWDAENQELIAVNSKNAYPVKDGIPVLLEESARELNDKEVSAWKKKIV